MRRDEFMKELEYLLQDIPDEDKADAIAYYQDYLEEAGPDNEEKVIQDFGSPERIAAIIRADINGSLENGGEFTENGYEDERFREPNFQLVKHQDLPEQNTNSAFRGESPRRTVNAGEETGENTRKGAGPEAAGAGQAESSGYGSAFGQPGKDGYGSAFDRSGREWHGAGNRGAGRTSGKGPKESGSGEAYGTGVTPGAPEKGRKRRWEWWQILGMMVMACCIVPVLLPLVLGIGGGAIGLVFGLGGGAVGILALLGALLLTVTIALAAVTFGLLLAGVLVIFVSFGQMAANGLQGILCLGTGVGILGLGLLCLAMCGLYYGLFLPWLFKSAIRLISRLVHRKEAVV